MSDELRIGLTTCDDEEAAKELARGLVDSGLAACVKIDSQISSIYRWKGEVHEQSEVRLMVKFPAIHSKKMEAFLLANHTYDVPEWVVLRPESVGEKYLEWALAPHH